MQGPSKERIMLSQMKEDRPTAPRAYKMGVRSESLRGDGMEFVRSKREPRAKSA